MAKKKTEIPPKEKKLASVPSLNLTLAELEPFGRIPTGLAAFDLFSGGGIPKGTISLLSGATNSGKTTVAIKCMANFHVQEPDRRILYLNNEKRIDPGWARIHGVDLARVSVVFPDSAEESHYLVRYATKNRPDVGLIIVDSLASLSPTKERDAEPDTEFMAIAARLNNQFFRQVTTLQSQLAQKGTSPTILILNQERQTVGMYSTIVVPGGAGQRFNCALWARFDKAEDKTDPQLGIPLTTLISFTFIKNAGGASKYSGSALMHVTPKSHWRIGDIQDQDFIFLWARNMGIVKSAGSKGFEMNGEYKLKAEWIHLWETKKDTYEKVKLAVHIGFQKWLNGDRQFVISQEGEANGSLAESREVLGEEAGREEGGRIGQ